ncbi:MAG: peptidoglycan DD-metalloendopeptidase family protein [Bacillota bacterium]|nr:peptidoglycan DD-metalloendopeptidase family protein [Bacillota bacterium]
MKSQKLTAFLLGIALIFAFSAVSPRVQAATLSSEAGIVHHDSGSLNIRAVGTSTGTILTRLPTGTYVTIISRQGNFYRVEYASGRYGYAYAMYVTKAASLGTAAVAISSGTLNVRTGAGASYRVKASLPKGRIVIVLSKASGYSRILYNGTAVGYVSSVYLSPSHMAWPVPASRKIAQGFAAGSHLGIDVAPSVQGVPGDRIAASAAGKVVYSGVLNGYGYVVYVNSYVNGRYIQTRYAHLKSAPPVGAGKSVSAGQMIGYMGRSGNSTGVHLHFEVRLRSSSGDCLANSASTPVNPFSYV